MRELEMHSTNGIVFLAVAEFDERTYFSAWYHNGLFQLHKDGTAEFIMLFDKYGSESPRHAFAFRVRDTIMFIPYDSEREIAVFTPKEKKMEYLKYPASEKKCMLRPFRGYINRNNITYLLPNNYDSVLAFNQDTGTFFRYVLPLESDAFCEEKYVFNDNVIIGDTVYFCPWNCSDMVSFNLKTYEFNILGKVKKNIFRHMFYIDGKIFLIPRTLEAGLLVYDIRGGAFLERKLPSVIQGICICAFSDEKENLYFLPHNESKVWIWNPVSGTLDSVNLIINNETWKTELFFNEVRDLWGGKIISTDYETLSHLIFDGKEIKVFDIHKEQGLFLDVLMNMAENRTGITMWEY